MLEEFSFLIFVLIAFLGIAVVVKSSQANDLSTQLQNSQNINNKMRREISDALEAKVSAELELAKKLKDILEKEKLYEVWSSSPAIKSRLFTEMLADYKTLYMELSARHLERKKRPAFKEAIRIREVRDSSKKILMESKLIEYKLAAIIDIFPDIEVYINDFESLEDLQKITSLENFADEHDRVRDYISNEDYQNLNSIERNQKALNNYISGSKKSNWQIGRDFEMSVGHEYEQAGWNVEYTGILKGLNDLGRDLVCKKDNKTEIVQCKYWAKTKKIHEKHIFQLFGTTVIYNSGREDLFSPPASGVFITNIKLSERAREYAKILNIKVLEEHPMTEFPRIKCNLGKNNNGMVTKIYHLPMDQHYDRTQMNDNNCQMMKTVKEAEESGYRRSYKWRGNK